MLVLTSRNQPDNIWIPKRMHLDKQPYKNQSTKNLPQYYKYSFKNTISSFKQAKCCTLSPLENLKNFKRNYIIVCRLASLPACQRNWRRYIAFKLSENKCYFCWHKPLLFRLQYSLCTIVCPLFIHSNQLIFLLETKVLTFHKGVDIPYRCWHSIKVLTFHARC